MYLKRPVIAIVGRPNVGKSTLFNRLIGRMKAVVSDVRGTTRDWVSGSLELNGIEATLVDTGGYVFSKQSGLLTDVQRHILKILDEADGILLVCEGPRGLVPQDAMIMSLLRKKGKPIIIAANKMDRRLSIVSDFFSLAPEAIVSVSALHNKGIDALRDELAKVKSVSSEKSKSALSRSTIMSVAIVGRQNVGKSSLLNKLLKDDRVIVSDVAGTTRDAVDTLLKFGKYSVCLIDTAGIRHKRKVKQSLDMYAMSRSIQAIRRSDVAIIVLDGTQGVTADDRSIIDRVIEEGLGFIIAVNKWDVLSTVKVPKADQISPKALEKRIVKSVQEEVPFAKFAPIIIISAKKGSRVTTCLQEVARVFRSLENGIPESECSQILKKAWESHPHPRIRGRAPRLKKVRWIRGKPHIVEIFTAPAGKILPSYLGYLSKRLYGDPRLAGVPVRLVANPRGSSRSIGGING